MVIKPVLFFLLGALGVTFLALLAAPGLRRRAARAERRRLEASLPLSMNEIESARDGLRAEFAVSTQRFEAEARLLREKNSEQAVAASRAGTEMGGLQAEIARLKEEAAGLAGEREESRAAAAADADRIRALEERLAEGSGVQAEIARLKEEAVGLAAERDRLHAANVADADRIRTLEERVAEGGRLLDERSGEVGRLENLFAETSHVASSRQIDLTAREGEIEQLGQSLAAAKKNADAAAGEAAELREALRAAEARKAEFDARANAMTTEMFNAEEQAEKHRGEAERLRGEAAAGEAERKRFQEGLEAALRERREAEAELAALKVQLAGLFPGAAAGGDPAAALQAAAAERDRLETRLAAVSRENKELRSASAAPPASDTPDAVLRENILSLAAEVASLVARLDGPDGPIDKALAAGGGEEGGPRPSLGERIRALRAVDPAMSARPL